MAYYRVEPSTGKWREVEAVTAGTGTNGGDWDWVSPAAYKGPDVVNDATPQLGGNLDLNGKDFDGEARFNNTVHRQKQTIASATTIDIASAGNHIRITGTTEIVTINGGEDGTIITLEFAAGVGTLHMDDGTGNIILPGREDYSWVAQDSVSLVYSGSDSRWLPVGDWPGARAGEIVMSGRSTAYSAERALPCDGATVSRTTYARLFAAIGTAYGTGDGSTTFNVPDLRDAFPIGTSGSISRGDTGGAASHDHNVTDGGHTHLAAPALVAAAGAGAAPGAMPVSTVGDVLGGNTASATTGLTVDSKATLPPYQAVAYFIFV